MNAPIPSQSTQWVVDSERPRGTSHQTVRHCHDLINDPVLHWPWSQCPDKWQNHNISPKAMWIWRSILLWFQTGTHLDFDQHRRHHAGFLRHDIMYIFHCDVNKQWVSCQTLKPPWCSWHEGHGRTGLKTLENPRVNYLKWYWKTNSTRSF